MDRIKKKRLVISRTTWARGKSIRMVGGNVLLNDSNMRCCLGFAAEQLCSATQWEIKNKSSPKSVPDVFSRGLNWLIFYYSSLDKNVNSLEAEDLISINDEELLDNSIREKKITEIFADHDIEVLFID